MVIPGQAGRDSGPRLVLPELGDIADDAFIDNHCFSYGGERDVGGQRSIEVDFRPAERVTQPDIEGSLFFDPVSFLIERGEIRLTKPSPQLLLMLKTVTVETRYGEIAPGIPIMVSYSAVSVPPESDRAKGWTASMTDWRLLAVKWLSGRP